MDKETVRIEGEVMDVITEDSGTVQILEFIEDETKSIGTDGCFYIRLQSQDMEKNHNTIRDLKKWRRLVITIERGE